MCGRYTLHHVDKLKQRYKLPSRQEVGQLLMIHDRYNIAPSQESVVIVLNENGEPEPRLMRWGYLPVWAHDPKDVFKYSTFNARAEGLFEKRTWKDAIKFRRALIPATGFYEWQKREDGKQPYFIRPKDEEIFSFAGLYGNWKDKDGREIGTFSIITTTPNDQMEPIHDRMPVILHKEDEPMWLDPSLDDEAAISSLLQPYGDNELELYEVSREVNSARSDEATFIQPMNSK